MIAKKRKLYTVVTVALLLIIGTVVGCAFAGAEIKPTLDSLDDIQKIPTKQQTEPTETEEPSTEPPIEPSETEPVPELTDLCGYLVAANVYDDSNCLGTGRMTVTDLVTGETASTDGGCVIDYMVEKLYWSEATQDREQALEGATCAVRLENVETGWYVDLYNNGYIYTSEYDAYVPARVLEADSTLSNMRITEFAERATAWLLNRASLVAIASDAYVVDALNLEYDDGKFDLRLPRIQLPVEGIEEINKEIMLTYSESFFGVNGPDYRPVVDYVWAVNGDILSVAVIPATNETRTMFAYNFSISEKRLLSNEEVYAACGLSDVQKRVSHAIACATGEYLFMDENGKIDVQKDSYLLREENVDFTISCFANGISQENFERAKPYLDEQGRLWVVADVYQMAGAANHKESICVEAYDTDVLYSGEEYFNYYAGLVG